MATPSGILEFWFGNEEEVPQEKIERWFTKDPDFDATVQRLFVDDVSRALRGEYKSWEDQPESALALILLLDQFPRNIYRQLPQSFSGDQAALNLSKKAIKLQWDLHVTPLRRVFFYMPLEHAEDLQMQNQSVQLFERLLEFNLSHPRKDLLEDFAQYARKHQEIVARFSRFPHRNWILGRPSTPPEVDFLKTPNSGF